MFWDVFENLCDSVGKKPSPVGKEIGVSATTISKWKAGAIPNGELLSKVADYFGCSTDYLLGRTNNPDFKSAEMLRDLSAEQWQDLLKYVQFLRWQKKAS